MSTPPPPEWNQESADGQPEARAEQQGANSQPEARIEQEPAAEPEVDIGDGAAEGGATGRQGQTNGEDAAKVGADREQGRFSERHRTVLGVIAIVVSLAIAGLLAALGPAVEPPPGPRGVAVRWGASACWFLLAVVFSAWTMRVKQATVQRLSYVVLGCYVLYVVARFL